MAKKRRDVIVAVIIVTFFVVAFLIFGVMMIGLVSSGGEVGFSSFGSGVGVLEVFGVMDEASGRPVVWQLDRWQDNSSIKAIVIHINSPGGEVAISQEIYDAILRARDEKPVVVSMASVAASGGYYIACGADRIMANPGTITGSIGVIMSYHTFEGLMDKMGIEMETIKSGEFKDVGNYSRQATKKERLMLKSVIMDGYEQFVEVIAQGRGMDKNEVYPLADGSIFTGLQAYNLGLVDTLGGLKEAISLAGELAGMEGEPNIIRPYKREKFSFFRLLEESIFGDFGRIVGKPSAGPRLLYLYN